MILLILTNFDNMPTRLS